MHIKALILNNKYSDSMSLMALSTKVNQLPYVTQAMIGMGTDLNKQVIAEVGLSTPEIEAATSHDQIIVVQTETEAEADLAIEQVEVLRAEGLAAASSSDTHYRAARQVYENEPDVTLTLISVPGEYATAEAMAALEHGRNVMIFSDNVSIEDEIVIKQRAHELGLLVMGPDCGTAIINGTGLAFANVVRPGPIGIVAASGTGSQELSVQIDALGSGISQLVGVGGRDLSEAVGGIMMLDSIEMLSGDPDTAVLVLLSKPPTPSVAKKVLEAAGGVGKPVVACFIGADAPKSLPANVTFVKNTRDAAVTAVRLATGADIVIDREPYDIDFQAIRAAAVPGQKYIRGLFCGGTVCDEVYHVLKQEYPDTTYSNLAKDPAFQVPKGHLPEGHLLIDLGADEYTRGRPHPMIDPTLRNAEIHKQAADPGTAVIVLDFELGFGSAADPVGAASSAITEARAIAESAGRPLEFVAYVLGTDNDPQNRSQQVAALRDLGVHPVSNVIDLATVSLQMIR